MAVFAARPSSVSVQEEAFIALECNNCARSELEVGFSAESGRLENSARQNAPEANRREKINSESSVGSLIYSLSVVLGDVDGAVVVVTGEMCHVTMKRHAVIKAALIGLAAQIMSLQNTMTIINDCTSMELYQFTISIS